MAYYQYSKYTKMHSAALVILVVVVFLRPTMGIKCWSCRSDIHPSCGEPFDNSTLEITDCDQIPEDLIGHTFLSTGLFQLSSNSTNDHIKGTKAIGCRVITDVSIKENGKTTAVIVRSCGWEGETTEVSLKVDGRGFKCSKIVDLSLQIRQESCFCNYRDGCNNAEMDGGLSCLEKAFAKS